MQDTIAALSTGIGRSAVAVIRLSGPACADILERLSGVLPEARRATLRQLRDPDTGERIDSGLILYFPGPGSFTGEDCAELQVHGSRAVTRRLLDILAGMPGVRLAEAGEFTRRAFENHKLDLLDVADLGDLIDSETEWQRRAAMGGESARLRQRIQSWRHRFVELLALVEAEIDFSDEADAAPAVQMIGGNVATLADEVAAAIANRVARERIRDGFRVVLAGAPNAGKSSLMNAIAGRDVAIVSPVPGTTRDVLEVRLDLRGMPVLLQDVAGMRETADEVEIIGLVRAQEAMAAADLVLWLCAADAPADGPPDGLTYVLVNSKADMAPEGSGAGMDVSSLTGEGIDDLLALIAERAEAGLAGREERLLMSARDTRCLQEAHEALIRAAGENRPEIVATELRLSVQALRRVLGEIGIEEVLGHIFARFCIGK